MRMAVSVAELRDVVEEVAEAMTITATCTLCFHKNEYMPSGLYVVITVGATGHYESAYVEFFCLHCRGLSHQVLAINVAQELVHAGVLTRHLFPQLTEQDAERWERMLEVLPDDQVIWFFQQEKLHPA